MKLQTWLLSIFFLLTIMATINAQTEKSIVSPTLSAPINSSAEKKNVAAPAFNLTSLDGKIFELASLRGKVVVLNFWFTGCVPCIAEMPKLNELVEKFKDDEVVFIAPTWDSKIVLQSFLKSHTFKYNIVPSAMNLIVKTYSNGTGEVAMPTSIIIDKEGNIHTRIAGGLIKTDGNTKEFDNFANTIMHLAKKSTSKTIIKASVNQ
jgi:peroxiredoxin